METGLRGWLGWSGTGNLAATDGLIRQSFFGSPDAGSGEAIRFFEVTGDAGLVAGTRHGGGHFVAGLVVDVDFSFRGHGGSI